MNTWAKTRPRQGGAFVLMCDCVMRERIDMYRTVKRILDIALSLLAGVVLLPLWGVFALCVCVSGPGPILFRQTRIGRGKRPFTILKFRTMRADAPHDIPTHELKEPEKYITPIGRFLRRTSLDELPQLWNVLVGDMSIIGPRPALWNQTDLVALRDGYVGRYGMTANDVRPGLSGLAQINGRDKLEIAEKARWDGEYVKRFGFLTDCRCVFATMDNVLHHRDVVEGGTGSFLGKDGGTD